MGYFIRLIGNIDSEEKVIGDLQVIEFCKVWLHDMPFIVPRNGELLPDVPNSDHASFSDKGYRRSYVRIPVIFASLTINNRMM